MNKLPEYYSHQQEADDEIENTMRESPNALVKMFCGTGKSLVMRKASITNGEKYIVYVFPSLGLVEQFCSEYLASAKYVLKISSEEVATTKSDEIVNFLKKNKKSYIICVTYQSLKTLLDVRDSLDISFGLCFFDEAHHCPAPTYRKLIFDRRVADKHIFMTATPTLEMHDFENIDVNHGICGPLAFNYTYMDALDADIINPFEIRIDFHLENTNISIYETIARAIWTTGNNRVLTFHADVETGRETSVNGFVNLTEFSKAFWKIGNAEFPHRIGEYTSIHMSGLSAKHGKAERRAMLDALDNTPDRTSVYIISSCETIGEGIDTKRANMCVFVDPKTSYVKIIQNLGRIVRKIRGIDKPASTVLIPCWVDRTKYEKCTNSDEKDAIIREDISKTGNFNGILNVMSALKQEDEELYNICLYYTSVFSPGEIRRDLAKRGCRLGEIVGDGGLEETLEHIFDEIGDDFDNNSDSDSMSIDDEKMNLEDFDTVEEYISYVAEQRDVFINIHTNSLENPIERYGNSDDDCTKLIRIFKEKDEDQYIPIIGLSGEEYCTNGTDKLRSPRRNNVKMNIHTNDEVKVLWHVVGDININNTVNNCIIDCEIVRYDPMIVAYGIVERCQERGGEEPRYISKPQNVDEKQEDKDKTKLGAWSSALRGISNSKCPDKVREYLDKHIPGWSDTRDLDALAMENAHNIVKRCQERGGERPRCIRNPKNTDEQQEKKDAYNLRAWGGALRGVGNRKCTNKIKEYLDEHIPGWNELQDLDALAMENARNIVKRCQERGGKKPRCITKPKNGEEKQEKKDACKLIDWGRALRGIGTGKCSQEIKEYLDEHISGWNDMQDLVALAMENARNIVKRCQEREGERPRCIINPKNADEKQEYKDACKLKVWGGALRGIGTSKCPDEVKEYLDEHIPGWNDMQDLVALAMKHAHDIAERCQERGGEMPKIRKTKSEKEKQENKDAYKLSDWRTGKSTCPDEVKEYLDGHIPGWSETNKKAPAKKNTLVRKSFVLNRNDDDVPNKKQKTWVEPDISAYHRKFKPMHSHTMRAKFIETPEMFYEYHRCSTENMHMFAPECHPHRIMIDEIDRISVSKRQKKVVDMGCGMAGISAHYKEDARFDFINYDHVACNETVTVCDISNMPLEDGSVDVCILSLAMWGSNCAEYVREAYRVLESGGRLFISEPTKRWSKIDENGYINNGDEGCRLISLLEESGFNIVKRNVDKFCLFVCMKM